MKKANSNMLYLFLLLAAVVMAGNFFLFCYRYDNKYMASSTQPVGGILLLQNSSDADTVLHLVEGWELYRDVLLSPSDFEMTPPLPDEYIYIGQYPGFDTGDRSRGPHGQASLRLTILFPDAEGQYMLELPEIFSAYRLYINGELLTRMGNPDYPDYQAITGNSQVTFTPVAAADGGGIAEILLVVSDYTHCYSGLVYPPAFGTPEAVTSLLSMRFALRTAVCAIIFIMGVTYLMLGILLKKQNLLLSYGALCMTFIGFAGYPVIKTLFPGGMLWYTIEIISYPLMFLIIIYIVTSLSGIFQTRGTLRLAAIAAVTVSVFMCLYALLSRTIFYDSLDVMLSYSALHTLYTWFCAVFLTLITGYIAIKADTDNVSSRILLPGFAILDTALAADRLLPDFEPIRSGWFIETAMLVLLLLTGAVMIIRITEQFRLRILMEQRLQQYDELVRIQRTQYPLLKSQIDQARAAQHDLRHHLQLIQSYLTVKDYEKLEKYLSSYLDNHQNQPVLLYSKHQLVNILLHYFAGQAEENNISFTVQSNIPDHLPVPDADLCTIISNLTENALEACSHVKTGECFISITLSQERSWLCILVDNSYDGKIAGSNGRILSRKRKNEEGIGLQSVLHIVREYDGSAVFTPDSDVFHSDILIPLTKEH